MLTSNFGGQEFGSMMYPPESYYGVNGSVSYLRDDLDFIIRDENPNIEFDKNNIFLISDDHTARKAVEGNPQYKVLFKDNNGVFNQLPDYFNPAEEKEAQERAVDAEGEALVKEIRAGGEYVKRRAQFEEKLESYEQTGRDLEYKERQAEYEAREGRPRRSVPASELYGDVTIASAFGSAVADSASLVADVAEAAIETKRAIIEPISDVVAEAGSRVIKSGERRRSAIISDTERRKGKE